MSICDGVDIFKKSQDGKMLWVESARDLEAAAQRIKDLAVNEPGEYLIFSQKTQLMVVRADR